MTATERCNSLSELKDNWDSYGAPPISKAAIEKAANLIELFQKIPAIVPTSMGGIQLEWSADVILEILPDGETLLG